jgi:hypothetical protein
VVNLSRKCRIMASRLEDEPILGDDEKGAAFSLRETN